MAMKVGAIGTGLMGEPMVEQLLAAGHAVIAYNRTQSKLEPLRAAGAEGVDRPEAVLAASECAIAMLTDASAIEATLLSAASRPHLAGKTIIQMGTIAPSESRAIAEQIQAAGGDYLEAPVLGSIPQAKTGTLQIMVGATPEQFQQRSELLSALGTPTLIGGVGTAAALKLALNQLIAALTSAFGLSLSFVQQQGVEVEAFMAILRESALYAPTFDKKLSRMVAGNYDNPNFPTKHLLKDAELFLREGQQLGLNTSALEGARSLLQIALGQGHADSDYSAVFGAIAPKKPDEN